MSPSASGDLVEDTTVSLDVRTPGIVTITFSHPKANCFTRAGLALMAEAIRGAEGTSGARIIVLKSVGESAFSAGASLAEVSRIRTAMEGEHFFAGFANLLLAMRTVPQLILAVVQGRAVGGALGLIAAADYAIAHESASVRLSEFEIGLGPFVIGPSLERKMGLARFSHLAIDCEWREATWALSAGLYGKICPSPERLESDVIGLATGIAARTAESVFALKRALWEGCPPWEDLLRSRAKISGELIAKRNSTSGPNSKVPA